MEFSSGHAEVHSTYDTDEEKACFIVLAPNLETICANGKHILSFPSYKIRRELSETTHLYPMNCITGEAGRILHGEKFVSRNFRLTIDAQKRIYLTSNTTNFGISATSWCALSIKLLELKLENIEILNVFETIIENLFLFLGAPRTCALLWKMHRSTTAILQVTQILEVESFTILAATFPALCSKNTDGSLQIKNPSILPALIRIAINLNFLPDMQSLGPDNFFSTNDDFGRCLRYGAVALCGLEKWAFIDKFDAATMSDETIEINRDFITKSRGINTKNIMVCIISNDKEAFESYQRECLKKIVYDKTPLVVFAIESDDSPANDEDWENYEKFIFAYSSIFVCVGTNTRLRLTRGIKSFPERTYSIRYIHAKHEPESSKIDAMVVTAVVDEMTVRPPYFLQSSYGRGHLMVMKFPDRPKVDNFVKNCSRIVSVFSDEEMIKYCVFLSFFCEVPVTIEVYVHASHQR